MNERGVRGEFGRRPGDAFCAHPVLLVSSILAGLLHFPAAGGETCGSSCGVLFCTFDGLRNEPLGGAVLSITESCTLRVDNIGGSGLDGVAQMGLSSLYMAMTLATPNFSLSAAGTRANIRQIGVVEGTSGQEIMLTQLVNYDTTHVRQSVTCEALGPANYTVHIYNGDTLVAAQDHGLQPPVFSYPKADITWMACGVLENGDLYGTTELGVATQITVVDWPTDPGPFTGTMIFVRALAAQLRASSQEEIDETFFATGPVEVTSMIALPGPCPPDEVGGVLPEGVSPTLIRFDSQDDLSGPSTSYRVATGRLSDLRATSGFSQAECLGVFPDAPAVDGRENPAAGEGFYYLIRGRTLCPLPGPGSYGDSTIVPDPRDKLDTTDPCPPA